MTNTYKTMASACLKTKELWKSVATYRLISSVPELFVCPEAGLTVLLAHSLAAFGLRQIKFFQIIPDHSLTAETSQGLLPEGNLHANNLV